MTSIIHKYDKPENGCPVCFEPLTNEDIVEPCKHWTHKKCIEKTNKAKCVICRGSLTNIILPKNLETKRVEVPFSEPSTSFNFTFSYQVSREIKMIQDTLNTLNYYKNTNHFNDFIDEEIEFFESILENNSVDDISNLTRVCNDAIIRCSRHPNEINNSLSDSSDEEFDEEFDSEDEFTMDEYTSNINNNINNNVNNVNWHNTVMNIEDY